MTNAVLKGAALGALILSGALAASQATLADDGSPTYDVTVRNLTLGQPVTPSVFVTHDSNFSIFTFGDPATDAFAVMAETGDPMPLADEVDGADGVDHIAVLPFDRDPPVMLPGESNTTTIQASDDANYFSAVAMLAATNDAFYAVRGVKLPESGSVTVYANAYDAGSEQNTELAKDIPAIGAQTRNDHADPGEGFVHVHSGVHGIANLNPAVHDWRNPVVVITITRVDDD